MTILDHDIQAKQAERDRLAAEVAEWVARNGKPPCYGPEVSASAGGDHYATRLAETCAAKRRKGKG